MQIYFLADHAEGAFWLANSLIAKHKDAFPLFSFDLVQSRSHPPIQFWPQGVHSSTSHNANRPITPTVTRATYQPIHHNWKTTNFNHESWDISKTRFLNITLKSHPGSS
jgi:hypothetical protein